MALTAEEQARLEKLKKLQYARKVDAARSKGQAEYDTRWSIDEGDPLYERLAKTVVQPVQQLAYGVARPFQQMYYGIKDLFGDGLSEEDKLRVEEIAGKEGLLATGGEIVGETAALAIPAAKVGQLMSSLAKSSPRLVKWATPFLTDLGFTVGAEGLKVPQEGKTREQNMADAAKGYVGTAIGLKGLGKAYKAVSPSKLGSKFLDEGIPLTPGQASDNPIIQGTEEALAAAPFVSSGVQDLQQKSLESWNTNLLNQASPGGEITGTGSEAFGQLIKGFDDAYGAAYKSIKPENIDFNVINNSFREASRDSANRVSGQLVRPTQATLKGAYDELKRFKDKGDKNALNNANKILRDANVDDRGAQDIFKKLRSEVTEAMGQGGGRLRAIDEKYAKFSILRDAATGTKDPLQSSQVIAPANLTGSMKKAASPNQLATGTGFMQQQAQEGTDVFSKTRPGGNLLRKSIAGASFGGAALLDPQVAATALLATAGATSETGRKLVTNMMQGASKQSAFADALREGVAKKTGLSADEINKLLYRSGALSQTAGDTEGYGN